MIPLPLIEGALFISGTFLEILCPRAQEYYKLNQRVAVSKGAGLDFGSKTHAALECHERMKEFYTDYEMIKSKVVHLLHYLYEKDPVEEGEWRNLNWAVEVYHQYAQRHQFDPWETLRYVEPKPCTYCGGAKELEFGVRTCPFCDGQGSSKMMVEVPFVFHLTTYVPNLQDIVIPIFYHGFIDRIVKKNNLIYVQDYKTNRDAGDAIFSEMRMSAPQKGYCVALKETLGIEPHGHIASIIRTKQPPVWLLEDGVPKKGPPKKSSDWWDESFREEIFYLGEGELEEWKTNTIAQVEEFFYHYQKGFFPQHKSFCQGKYKCQYYDCCSTFPAKDRLLLLNSDMFKNHEPKLKKEKEQTT